MKLSRRHFVVGSLSGGAAIAQRRVFAQGVPLDCLPPLPSGQPVAFAPPAGLPTRIRKSAFDLDASESTRLKAAYAALRRLYEQSPNDARGWLHQGLVHCWYCSGAGDGLNGQEIHGGWWFLPWHRAFLYFHERILAILLGDPTFALPYWDWDTPGRNRVPDVYRTPSDTSNPLFDPTRKAGANDRIPDFLVGPKEIQSVLGQMTFALFGGAGEGASGQMGAMEGAPHGGVHLWSTDPIKIDPNNPQIDMGVLATAALDPIFFAHHANIDRLWNTWTESSPSHVNPPDAVWPQQQFLFYDQQAQWTAIAVSQVLQNEATLRYKYQSPGTAPSTATPVAAAQARPAPAPGGAEAAVSGPPIMEFSTNSALKTLTPEPATLELEVPGVAKDKLSAAVNSASRLVLRIDGVQIPSDRGALAKVFLNNPAATAATPTSDPSYVGSIVVAPATARGVGPARQDTLRNFAFDITAQMAGSLTNQRNLSVTLVPFQGQGVKPEVVSMRYRRVYVMAQ